MRGKLGKAGKGPVVVVYVLVRRGNAHILGKGLVEVDAPSALECHEVSIARKIIEVVAEKSAVLLELLMPPGHINVEVLDVIKVVKIGAGEHRADVGRAQICNVIKIVARGDGVLDLGELIVPAAVIFGEVDLVFFLDLEHSVVLRVVYRFAVDFLGKDVHDHIIFIVMAQKLWLG